MINQELNLTKSLFSEGMEERDCRDGFVEGLIEAAKQDDRIVVVSADISTSTRERKFADKFPKRHFEVGVSEQNLVNVASGLAAAGKIPFIVSYAIFSPGRNWEMIRTTIALNNLPVKIIGSHAGINVGADGATHQALEDIALMRVLPNMTVIAPCDFDQTKKAVIEAAKTDKPVYIRFGKEKSAVITTYETPFEIGKAQIVYDSRNISEIQVDESGQDESNKHFSLTKSVAIISSGPLLYQTLLAAKALEDEGVGCLIVNNHSVKPMDNQTIVEVAQKCGAVVTVEDHQEAGGMGSAVAELLVNQLLTPIEFVAVKDSFGESGTTQELYQKHNLTKDGIVDAVKKVIERKSAYSS